MIAGIYAEPIFALITPFRRVDSVASNAVRVAAGRSDAAQAVRGQNQSRAVGARSADGAGAGDAPSTIGSRTIGAGTGSCVVVVINTR